MTLAYADEPTISATTTTTTPTPKYKMDIDKLWLNWTFSGLQDVSKLLDQQSAKYYIYQGTYEMDTLVPPGKIIKRDADIRSLGLAGGYKCGSVQIENTVTTNHGTAYTYVTRSWQRGGASSPSKKFRLERSSSTNYTTKNEVQYEDNIKPHTTKMRVYLMYVDKTCALFYLGLQPKPSCEIWVMKYPTKETVAPTFCSVVFDLYCANTGNYIYYDDSCKQTRNARSG